MVAGSVHAVNHFNDLGHTCQMLHVKLLETWQQATSHLQSYLEDGKRVPHKCSAAFITFKRHQIRSWDYDKISRPTPKLVLSNINLLWQMTIAYTTCMRPRPHPFAPTNRDNRNFLPRMIFQVRSLPGLMILSHLVIII